jgi:Ribbon-helix-helix domain
VAPRNLNAQPIYLEPDKAAKLDALAAETRIRKAELLREAVDDLLAKHGKDSSELYDTLRAFLRTSRAVATRVVHRGYRGKATEDRARRMLTDVEKLQSVFDKNRPLP